MLETPELGKPNLQDKISNTPMLDELINVLQTPLVRALKHAFGGGG